MLTGKFSYDQCLMIAAIIAAVDATDIILHVFDAVVVVAVAAAAY